MRCKYCSFEAEKRGTRERNGEPYARLYCYGCKKWSSEPLKFKSEPSFEKPVAALADYAKYHTFIITSAMNNCQVDKKVWSAIQTYAKHMEAAIIVIPVMYRNPTMPGQIEQEDAWWPSEVAPYLMQNDLKITENCRVMGNVKVQATATNPLSGLDSLSRGDSAIIGHAQVQLRCVATPQNRLPKILQTTGSVSEKSYSKSKAGVLAAFHHSLGFAIVEKDNNDESIFHIRSVVADDASEFYDLDNHVTAKSVKKGKRAEALVLGDEHTLFTSQAVRDATFGAVGTDGKDSVVAALKPKYLVRHDLIDSYSISHHHRDSPDRLYAKTKSGFNRLDKELLLTSLYLEATTPKGSTSVIVPSNHSNHIAQWLREVDWRSEPWNAKIYHQMWAAWLEAIDNKEYFHPFNWWMKANCKADALYLQPDYPFIVKGIYLGYHGDKGINGAKGSLGSFAKIGVKTVIGHWHSPGVEKGAYLIGTSTQLNLEYTEGPSSWLNTHCPVYANGKRQLIHIIKGRWRRERGNQ